MQQDDFEDQVCDAYQLPRGPEHPFNLGNLDCRTKAPTTVDPQAGDVYAPAATRPLSIMDTSNRILASAFTLRWEPLRAGCVSSRQRGFLPGRSKLANIVGV